MLPPISPPISKGVNIAASAAADPPDDPAALLISKLVNYIDIRIPPGVRDTSYGLFVLP